MSDPPKKANEFFSKPRRRKPGKKTSINLWCSVAGCPNVSHAKSLCMSHYRRLLRGGVAELSRPIQATYDRGASRKLNPNPKKVEKKR